MPFAPLDMEDMPVVILCGGAGTRLREETEFRPKPLVQIGGKPILWHIMKHYAHYGFKNFILCLGYKGDMIKEYFMNYHMMTRDFTLNLHTKKGTIHHETDPEDWNITFVDTGQGPLTGGRVKKVEKFITTDNFLLTYGDGVSDVDLHKLVAFHKEKGKIGTLTGIHPTSKYGTVKLDENNVVAEFTEKPVLNDVINGGFFVFNKELFKYIEGDVMLEKEPFEKLATDKEMALFKHEGFWKCMDTFKDAQDFNEMCNEENMPWKIWKE